MYKDFYISIRLGGGDYQVCGEEYQVGKSGEEYRREAGELHKEGKERV